MAEYTTQRLFFFALLFLVTLAFFWLIRGFMQPIFWAVALGIIVYPAHAQLVQRLNNRPSLAAVTSVITVVLLVILPLIGIGAAVTSEATALLNSDEADTVVVEGASTERADDQLQRAETQQQREEDRQKKLDFNIDAVFAWVEEHVPQLASALDTLGIDAETVDTQLASAALFASEFVATRALAIGQNTLRMALFFFLMLYLLFFFLRDGTRLLDGLVRALPLGDARERHLLERFAQVARATIKGTLVVGIVQGTIGGIAFAVLGLRAPVLWGVLMALLSILPAIGPAVVWIPAAIILFVDDRYIAGIALVLIGVLVIGLVDNVLRPILVGRDTRMPDYLVLLSTLGGLAAFGLAGIVIGPIIAAFFLSVWEMAQADFEHEEAAARADKRRALRTPAAAAAHDAAGVEAAPAPAMLGRGSGGAPNNDNEHG
jgi:predicted PurR-regulated permease PerM